MKNIFIHPLFENIYHKYPLVLIDVGACGGICKRWKRAERYLEVIGFEPDERAFEKLSTTKKNKFVNMALGEQDGEITLYITKKEGCSSVYCPNFEFLKQFPDVERFRVIGSVKLPARQLSSQLLQAVDIDNPDFLKVDIQGSELLVLRGASHLIEDLIFGIEVEVEFVPLYLNQPLFADIDNFLQGKGFYLFDLKRYYWKRKEGIDTAPAKGQVIFADALYLKTYEKIYRNVSNMNYEQQKAKVLKAISICLLYKIYDYALYLANRAFGDSLFTFKERGLILKSVRNKKLLENYSLAYRLSSIFYKAYRFFHSDKFYFADKEIGN